MTDEGLDHSFTLPVGDLVKLIDRTRFAISTEETRYYLNGIFLHAVDEGAASCLRQRRHRWAIAWRGSRSPSPRAPPHARA